MICCKNRQPACHLLLSALVACTAAAPVALPGCGSSPPQNAVATPPTRFQKISQYALFAGDPAAQQPAPGVIPYDINSALFSDYAEKFRFIKLPAGASATYRSEGVFDFPVGTIIAKTFAYPRDARDPSQARRLIETRILKHEPDGWVGLPYVWNEAQSEATLDVAGDTVNVSWIHTDGCFAQQLPSTPLSSRTQANARAVTRPARRCCRSARRLAI